MSKNIDITAAVAAVTSNPFAIASQKRYRFQVPGRGVLVTEDLWNMSVEELSAAYQSLDAASKKASEGRSLLEEDKVDPETSNMLSIIETIFNFKVASKKIAEDERSNKDYMQKVASALQTKRNKRLEDMSEEELEAILKNGGPINPDGAPATED